MKKEIKTETYQGLLCLHTAGDADDVLFLSSLKDPLARELQWMNSKKVTVRYWVTDRQVTKEEAEETFVQLCMGKAKADYGSHYSDMTGYLWTDEELNVGGHNIIEELKSYVGKWLIMEVDA